MQKPGVEGVELNNNPKFESIILNKTISSQKYFSSKEPLLLSFAVNIVLICFYLINFSLLFIFKLTASVSAILFLISFITLWTVNSLLRDEV